MSQRTFGSDVWNLEANLGALVTFAATIEALAVECEIVAEKTNSVAGELDPFDGFGPVPGQASPDAVAVWQGVAATAYQGHRSVLTSDGIGLLGVAGRATAMVAELRQLSGDLGAHQATLDEQKAQMSRLGRLTAGAGGTITVIYEPSMEPRVQDNLFRTTYVRELVFKRLIQSAARLDTIRQRLVDITGLWESTGRMRSSTGPTVRAGRDQTATSFRVEQNQLAEFNDKVVRAAARRLESAAKARRTPPRPADFGNVPGGAGAPKAVVMALEALSKAVGALAATFHADTKLIEEYLRRLQRVTGRLGPGQSVLIDEYDVTPSGMFR